jgi:hypothetical protein
MMGGGIQSILWSMGRSDTGLQPNPLSSISPYA